MKKTYFNILIIFVLAVSLFACQAQQKEQPATVTNISAQQLHQMLENKDFTLVNVHTPYAGEIPNTDLFIPFNEISEYLAKLPNDKNAKLVLYCRSGHMSTTAVQELIQLGYKHVYDVTGGMNAWRDAGYEIISKEQ